MSEIRKITVEVPADLLDRAQDAADAADPIEDALGFVGSLRSSERAVWVEPGPRHWEIFERLCRVTSA